MLKMKPIFLFLSIIIISCQDNIEDPILHEDENQENMSEYDKVEIRGEVKDMITKERIAPVNIEVLSVIGIGGPIQTYDLIGEYVSDDGTYIAELDFIADTSRLIRIKCSDVPGNKYFENGKSIWIDSMDSQLDIELCPISYLKTEIKNIGRNVDKLSYEFIGYQCDEIEEPINRIHNIGFASASNPFISIIPLPVSSEINTTMKIYEGEELIIDTVMLFETIESDTITIKMEF